MISQYIAVVKRITLGEKIVKGDFFHKNPGYREGAGS